MKPIPLFGSATASKSLTVTSQRRLNVYYEIRQDQDQTKIAIYGTPGTEIFVNVGSTPVRGSYVFGTLLYIVQAGRLYSINNSGTIINRGTLNTTSGTVSMSDNGTQLLIVDGTNGYTYTPGTTTFAQITDVNFQNGATTCDFLGGFFAVERPGTGQYYISKSYDGTVWTPALFATAESNTDNLVAVQSYLTFWLLWGEKTIEPWQNAGLSPFPFAPIQGAVIKYGLAAKFSRAPLSGGIAYLAKNDEGSQVEVRLLTGLADALISDPDTTNLINSFSTTADAIALSYKLDTHSFYQINFPTAGRSLLYDASTSIWSEVQTGVALTGRHIANQSVHFNNSTYVTDYSAGNIFKINPNVYTDNGTAIKRQIRSRHIRQDGNLFTVDELTVEMETGVGLQAGQGSDPQVMIQYSHDGGRTYGIERWFGLGKVGQYLIRLVSRRWGQCRDGVYQITMTDPVKFVITKAEAVLRPGRG